MARFLSPVAAPLAGALKAVLRKRLPQSAAMWNILKFLEQNNYSKRVQTVFYMDEDGNTDPLIVCVQHRKFPVEEDMIVSMSAPTGKACVINIPTNFSSIFKWSIPVSFAGVELDLANNLKLTDLCSSHGRVSSLATCNFYYFPLPRLNDKVSTRLPEGVTARPLVTTEAEIVQSSWQYAGPGTLERLEDAISTIGSCGVYVHVAKTLRLVSWVTVSHAGTINALHTTEAFRRSGYAELAMKGVTEMVGKSGAVPNAHVELDNVASRALLERLGYIRSGRVVWITYSPSKDPQESAT